MLGIWSNLVLDWGFIHNLVLPPVNSQLSKSIAKLIALKKALN